MFTMAKNNPKNLGIEIQKEKEKIAMLSPYDEREYGKWSNWRNRRKTKGERASLNAYHNRLMNNLLGKKIVPLHQWHRSSKKYKIVEESVCSGVSNP